VVAVASPWESAKELTRLYSRTRREHEDEDGYSRSISQDQSAV